MKAATHTQYNFDLRIVGKEQSDYLISNKQDLIGLDKHLQVSVMASLFHEYLGASNYVNDNPDPSNVSQHFVCRIISREEGLDLKTLISQKMPSLTVDERKQATHVVVGVFYGAEAYCVLTHDLNGNDESRKTIEMDLSQLISKWKTSLTGNQDVFEFKEKFDTEEKLRLHSLKCRIYADLQAKAVRECSVFEAYKQCLILIDQVQHSSNDHENSVAVPIAVLLCPIEALTTPFKKISSFPDVDADLVSRCHKVWIKLERIRIKADALRAGVRRENRSRLRRFVDAIVQYQQMLKKSLKNAVLQARKNPNTINGVQRIVNTAENHRLFSPSKLKRWLYYEQADLEMTEKLVMGVNGISFVADMESFDPKPPSNKKFTLLLFVPSLNDMVRNIIGEMESHVEGRFFCNPSPCEVDDYAQDGDSTEDEEETDGIAFHTVRHKRELLQSKMRELKAHIERNQSFENQCHYLVTHDRNQRTKCSYHLYDYSNYSDEDQDPMVMFPSQLPKQPTNLRIQSEVIDRIKRAKMSSSFITIEWDYRQNDEFPCHFVVEYRPKGSGDNWERKETDSSHLTLDFETSTEVRVAAGCYIGLGEFSDVIYSDSAIEEDSRTAETPTLHKLPQLMDGSSQSTTVAVRTKNMGISLPNPSGLKIGLVTQTSAEIHWIPLPENPSFRFTYGVCCWPEGQEPPAVPVQNVASSESGCRLDRLDADQRYFISISTTSIDWVLPSDSIQPLVQPVTFKTLAEDVRFAQMLVGQCEKLENRQGMDVYAVPLMKNVPSGSDPSAVQRFAFGRAVQKKRKTILLVGASGSGKTSLINGILNYIFDVEWTDPFRFQLSETAGRINVYDIHHYEGFSINYSLTIIDTPGYGEDKVKNEEITEMIRKFFQDKDGAQELDMVGFVMKSPLPKPTTTEKFIYESLISIFGDEIKESVNYLLTFAGKENPPLLDAIASSGLPVFLDEEEEFRHFKFDNSAFFCWNGKLPPGNQPWAMGRIFELTADYNYNSFLWSMGVNNLYSFFSSMDGLTTKSLALVKQLLDEKKRLESTIDGLESLIDIGLMKLEELRTVKQTIAKTGNAGFQVQVAVPRKFEIPFGTYLTNCTKCNITCHKSCGSDDGKFDCDVMDHSKAVVARTCLVCPGNCLWNVHESQYFRWEYVLKPQTTSLAAVKEKYEAKLRRALTVGGLIMELEKETEAREKLVLDQFMAIAKWKERLDRMAGQSGSRTTLQLVNVRVVDEKRKKLTGYLERIKSLKRIRLLCVINSFASSKTSTPR